MKRFEYVQPATLEDASKAAGEKGAKLKAAGIDLLDEMKSYIETPASVVNLLAVPGMRDIADHKDGTRIGALVTLAQIADSKLPACLVEAARGAATPQIRNVATVGGNLAQRPRCWYYRSEHFSCLKKGGSKCFAIEGENRYHAIFENGKCPIVHPSNLAPAFVALNATVRTTKRELPIEKFFVAEVERENVLGVGEVIREVVLPVGNVRTAYREGREKESFDWALVSAAVALGKDDARVVLGAVAPVPRRCLESEKMLAGKTIDEALAEAAAAKAFEGATPLSQNKYKIPLGKTILKRAILAAAGKGE